MDSGEAHRQIVTAFCTAYSAGDWEEVAGLLHEEFRWKAMASQRRQSAMLVDAPCPNESPGRDKAETIAIFRATKDNCVDARFDLTPVSFTCEGDCVAFEATSFAINKHNGRIYDNRYHHLVEILDGKIIELREYQDTLLAFDVWMAP